jgi:hypothetical protein
MSDDARRGEPFTCHRTNDSALVGAAAAGESSSSSGLLIRFEKQDSPSVRMKLNRFGSLVHARQSYSSHAAASDSRATPTIRSGTAIDAGVRFTTSSVARAIRIVRHFAVHGPKGFRSASRSRPAPTTNLPTWRVSLNAVLKRGARLLARTSIMRSRSPVARRQHPMLDSERSITVRHSPNALSDLVSQ